MKIIRYKDSQGNIKHGAEQENGIVEVKGCLYDEWELTDAIAALLKEQRVLAYEFRGKRFDCGNKLGYLQATVAYGLEHPDTGDKFREHLKEVLEGSAR